MTKKGKKKSSKKVKKVVHQSDNAHVSAQDNSEQKPNCRDSEMLENDNNAQPSRDKRITWRTVQIDFMDLWGLGSKSMPRTLWRLVCNPGEVISNYIINGRQTCFPPLKMLFFVSIFAYFFVEVLGPVSTSQLNEEDHSYFVEIVNWMSTHIAWATLISFSLFIFPTYILFRRSPYLTKHTIPEGFFIQVFNGSHYTLLMIVFTIGKFFLSLFFTSPSKLTTLSNSVDYILSACAFVMLFRTYKQLFGFSFWPTLWRLIDVLLSSFFILILFYMIDYGLNAKDNTGVISGSIMLILLLLILLLGGWLIDRHTSKKRAKKISSQVEEQTS